MGRGFDHSLQERERVAQPRAPQAPSAASLQALAPRLGNQAFGRLLAADRASLQRVLFIKSSSIQRRDADGFKSAYDKVVKPIITEIVVEPHLRQTVRAKLAEWAAAPGITPRPFDTWEEAVREAYAAVKPPPPNTNNPQPPSGGIPSTSEIKEEKTEVKEEKTEVKEPNTEIQEEKKTRTRRQPTEEEKFWMGGSKRSQPKVLTKEDLSAKASALDKELTLLHGTCKEQVAHCFEFLCHDWKSWKNECLIYLNILSQTLQSAVTTMCKLQISYCECQKELFTILGDDVEASKWGGMGDKISQRLPDAIPLCILHLDQQTWATCEVFANGYLQNREGPLTESVKTAQKQTRAAPLAALRAQIYRDLSKQFSQLLLPSKPLMQLCKVWAKLLTTMAQKAEAEAEKQSELHAGRNQSSHF